MVSAEITVAIIQYSPDLASSNFFPFPKMNEHLAGKRFANDEDLKDAVKKWLNNQAATRYEEGIHKLLPRYDKCLNVKGDNMKSRQRYVPKLVYSISVLLLKNILVWRNVLYF